jgi:hypothetical protein
MYLFLLLFISCFHVAEGKPLNALFQRSQGPPYLQTFCVPNLDMKNGVQVSEAWLLQPTRPVALFSIHIVIQHGFRSTTCL